MAEPTRPLPFEPRRELFGELFAFGLPALAPLRDLLALAFFGLPAPLLALALEPLLETDLLLEVDFLDFDFEGLLDFDLV